jgi:hypothetical protein
MNLRRRAPRWRLHSLDASEASTATLSGCVGAQAAVLDAIFIFLPLLDYENYAVSVIREWDGGPSFLTFYKIRSGASCCSSRHS